MRLRVQKIQIEEYNIEVDDETMKEAIEFPDVFCETVEDKIGMEKRDYNPESILQYWDETKKEWIEIYS